MYDAKLQSKVVTRCTALVPVLAPLPLSTTFTTVQVRGARRRERALYHLSGLLRRSFSLARAPYLSLSLSLSPSLARARDGAACVVCVGAAGGRRRQRPFAAEDDLVLRHIPYFGDDDRDDMVSEHFGTDKRQRLLDANTSEASLRRHSGELWSHGGTHHNIIVVNTHFRRARCARAPSRSRALSLTLCATHALSLLSRTAHILPRDLARSLSS